MLTLGVNGPSGTTLRRLRDDASDPVHIENNAVLQIQVANHFRTTVSLSSLQSYHSIDADTYPKPVLNKDVTLLGIIPV